MVSNDEDINTKISYFLDLIAQKVSIPSEAVICD